MSAAGASTAERLYRARRIGVTFGRVYLGIKAHQFVARRLRPRDMSTRWRRFNLQSARTIYQTAVDLRGLILKGCQFMGSRADVLPREYVEVLSKLQDRVPPKSFGVVRRTLEREFGRPMNEVFTEFVRRPIAAASLAQVHEARLHDGRRVAVKVQYPEIASLVRTDLASLRSLFRAVGYVEQDFDLMPVIDELSTMVPRELDFVNEGRNAETMARFFAGSDDIRVPSIVWEHTTPRVLVMEFMDGIKISDVDALRAAGVDRQRVVQILADAFCEQILGRGVFHADPHPGNLFVQPDGPRLVLLDFGLVKDLPARFREGIVGFAGAMLSGDSGGMARSLADLGFETLDGRPDSLMPVARLFLDVARQYRSATHLDPAVVKRIREELSETVRSNPIVRIPGHLVLLGRALALLSGVSRDLGARVDLLRTVLPHALGTSGSANASA